MSKQNDNPADPFKKALAEATKVMAADPDLQISYSVDPAGQTNDSIRLPQISRRMTRDEVLLARGTADAFALRHKYHDAGTNNRYAPQGQMARDIYDAMETARVEAVGARHMPGTAKNIDAKIGTDALRKGYDQITQAADAPLATAAGYLVRHLAKAGAELFLSDIRQPELKALAEETGATIVEDPKAIYDVEADIFTPCALGAVINPDTIDRLKVKIVAGAANNQLLTRDMGAELQKRGILYAPDYVINAGGIINVMGEIDSRFNGKWVEGKLVALKSTLGEILDKAENEGRPANIVCDQIARERIAEAAALKQAAA